MRSQDYPNDPPQWLWDGTRQAYDRGKRVGRITLPRYWCAFRVDADGMCQDPRVAWMAGYYDTSADAMGLCINLDEDGTLVLAPDGAKFGSAEEAKAAAEVFEATGVEA